MNLVTKGREVDRTIETIFRIQFLLANYQETKLVKPIKIVDKYFDQGECRRSSLARFLN